MSLKSNYAYIRDWINVHFLKKEDIDLTIYPTESEIYDNFPTKEQVQNTFLSKDEYSKEEEIIASSLVDLDGRIKALPENLDFVGSSEEEVISHALNYLNNKDENKEDVENKVTSLSSSSTNDQYPSAKCVYDRIVAIENRLSQLEQNQGS